MEVGALAKADATRVFMHMDSEKCSMHIVELFYTTDAPILVHIDKGD